MSLRQREIAVLARIPGPEQGGNVSEIAAQAQIASRIDDHDDVRVDGQDLLQFRALQRRHLPRTIGALMLKRRIQTAGKNHGVRRSQAAQFVGRVADAFAGGPESALPGSRESAGDGSVNVLHLDSRARYRLETLQDADLGEGAHLGTAAAGDDGFLAIRTGDHEMMDRPALQRQERPLVLQEHDAFAGDLERRRRAFRIVERD